MREFYDSHSLAEIFDAYRSARPDAHAIGSVHSFTLTELLGRLAKLKGYPIAVANIVRHPISYIDSHFALVRRAEMFPAVYAGYATDMFPRAVEQFQELYLVDCPSYREFLALAVSCLSAINVSDDLSHIDYRHVQMELLTTDAVALGEFCQSLTGLVYPQEQLESFIAQGAINRHRPASRSKDPRSIYEGWPEWMRDLAAVMLSEAVLQKFEGAGYDVEMLRQQAPSIGVEKIKARSLADRLQAMDPNHPLLRGLNSGGAAPGMPVTEPVLYEEGYRGFNLVKYGHKVYALSQKIGAVDLRVDAGSLEKLYGPDQVIVSDSIESLKDRISVIGRTSRVVRLVIRLRRAVLRRILPR